MKAWVDVRSLYGMRTVLNRPWYDRFQCPTSSRVQDLLWPCLSSLLLHTVASSADSNTREDGPPTHMHGLMVEPYQEGNNACKQSKGLYLNGSMVSQVYFKDLLPSRYASPNLSIYSLALKRLPFWEPFFRVLQDPYHTIIYLSIWCN